MIWGRKNTDKALGAAVGQTLKVDNALVRAAQIARLKQLKAERDPASLPLSLMTTWIVAETREGVVDYASRLSAWRGRDGDGERFLAEAEDYWIVGTVEEAVEQLHALHGAGVTRVMAQHLLHRDIDAIELIGREVAPLIERF